MPRAKRVKAKAILMKRYGLQSTIQVRLLQYTSCFETPFKMVCQSRNILYAVPTLIFRAVRFKLIEFFASGGLKQLEKTQQVSFYKLCFVLSQMVF